MTARTPSQAAGAVERIRAGLERVRTTREVAVPAAVEAIRALEAELQAALAGGKLRGLAVLASPSFRAARLLPPPERGGPEVHRGIDTPLQAWPARPALVLTEEGSLEWAHHSSGGCRTRAVPDAELRAEHLEDFVCALFAVAERHASRCDRTAQEWAAVADLATRVREALG